MRCLLIRECLAFLTGHLIVHLYGIDGLLVKSAEEAEAHYQKLPRGPGRTITFGTFTASKVSVNTDTKTQLQEKLEAMRRLRSRGTEPNPKESALVDVLWSSCPVWHREGPDRSRIHRHQSTGPLLPCLTPTASSRPAFGRWPQVLPTVCFAGPIRGRSSTQCECERKEDGRC